MALRPCTTPACAELVTGRNQKCDTCRARQQASTRTRRTPPRTAGYDRQWEQVRRTYLADHPACELHGPHCTTTATIVDHIVPLTQGGDRLNPTNLQAVCRPCHQHKTWHTDGAQRTSALHNSGADRT